MKKLLILALLLGLTGCGDNNQSDTQTNTLQKAEVIPAVANYSLAAAPRTFGAVAPLAGWNVTKSIVMGASTLIDAIKDTKVSAALITPNAKQVAEVLRGGAAGIALNIAVDQLLGAVDWVMDPANNQIVYYEKPKDISDPTIKYIWTWNSKYYFTPEEACDALVKTFNTEPHKIFKNLGGGKYIAKDSYDCKISFENTQTHYRDTRMHRVTAQKNPAYDPNAERQKKTLPLETVAEQVITNADAGSLDAQVATNLAAQNILNDVEQAEPVVQDLENNARNNCPSGIRNEKGDCWVCSRESWAPIRGRVVYAKDVTDGLNKCSAAMNSSQLLTRYTAFLELGVARDAENACWSPQDGEHLKKAIEAKKVAADCNELLGLLGN